MYNILPHTGVAPAFRTIASLASSDPFLWYMSNNHMTDFNDEQLPLFLIHYNPTLGPIWGLYDTDIVVCCCQVCLSRNHPCFFLFVLTHTYYLFKPNLLSSED